LRITVATHLLVLFSGLSYAQTGNNPENVIRRMVTTGLLEGHDEKVINSMGDAAAVVLTKVFAGNQPTASEIDTALVVLRHSFVDPRSVEISDDRQPRTALFVLKSLDQCTQDAAVKRRIADATRYVQDRYASYLRGQQN
jgi:hypothetical protein